MRREDRAGEGAGARERQRDVYAHQPGFGRVVAVRKLGRDDGDLRLLHEHDLARRERQRKKRIGLVQEIERLPGARSIARERLKKDITLQFVAGRYRELDATPDLFDTIVAARSGAFATIIIVSS